MTHPILLRVSNFKAYVWDVDDINILRSHHHICGILTGTLPHLSSQNIFLGLPLQLMPEEAVLLVENGIAVFVDDPNAHIAPSPLVLKLWQEARLSDVRQQIALTEEKESIEASNPDRAMSESAKRKRKEREERRARAMANTAPNVATEDSPSSPTPENPSQPAIGESPDSAIVPSAPHTVHIPASSSTLEWYAPHSHSSLTIAREAGIWQYPSTLQERARCGVFRDLWEKGYYMGGGIKFGGEYLVYPGDPLRYHSHFVASVIEAPDAALRPMEIVAHGRLGTGTKKAHLLCEWNDESQVVSYLSIEWAGFG
ncbi:tRNA-intron endonuclease catalytic domain-like protein [Suillus paluster]|uniref:tRNA-intron endonuclease catalytic domain-like protein n=1 Tax=Suillus paluster TaxID=48578 RepID=UPI001B8642E9|nr:tRNA-intron endonuclease catalytic domain-like protein [Suillus paluster]KAG1756469.1 tRNA-intron endonuclease catalytic domain-like protein [Suillus paluster]